LDDLFRLGFLGSGELVLRVRRESEMLGRKRRTLVLNSLRFGLDGINGEVVSTVFSLGTAGSRAKSEQFGVSCQE
jgi:hypothetical protein